MGENLLRVYQFLGQNTVNHHSIGRVHNSDTHTAIRGHGQDCSLYVELWVVSFRESSPRLQNAESTHHEPHRLHTGTLHHSWKVLWGHTNHLMTGLPGNPRVAADLKASKWRHVLHVVCSNTLGKHAETRAARPGRASPERQQLSEGPLKGAKEGGFVGAFPNTFMGEEALDCSGTMTTVPWAPPFLLLWC